MKNKKVSPFVKRFIKMIGNEVGCKIQYNGCPCNTCFHSWAEKDLGLSPEISHLFWFVVLELRGDYSTKDIIEGVKEHLESKLKVSRNIRCQETFRK